MLHVIPNPMAPDNNALELKIDEKLELLDAIFGGLKINLFYMLDKNWVYDSDALDESFGKLPIIRSCNSGYSTGMLFWKKMLFDLVIPKKAIIEIYGGIPDIIEGRNLRAELYAASDCTSHRSSHTKLYNPVKELTSNSYRMINFRDGVAVASEKHKGMIKKYGLDFIKMECSDETNVAWLNL